MNGTAFALLSLCAVLLWVGMYVEATGAFRKGWRGRLANRVLCALFEHADVTKRVGGEVKLYLRRYFVRHSSPTQGGIYVHHICRSDDDRDPHDHPWPYRSVVLSGGYWEEEWRTLPADYDSGHPIRPWRAGVKWHGPLSFLRRPATWLHRLRIPAGEECWTLVITGPQTREWGFETDEGWVPQQEYKNRSAT